MDDTGTRYTPIRIRPNSMSTQMQTKVISQPNALGGYGILYAAAVMHRGGGQRRHFEIQKFVNGPSLVPPTYACICVRISTQVLYLCR